MSLPGKILLIIGIIYTIVGIIAKIFSLNIIDGASLILVGLFTVLAGIGGFDINNVRQSRKRKIFDWICFFLIFFGGIASYLREW